MRLPGSVSMRAKQSAETTPVASSQPEEPVGFLFVAQDAPHHRPPVELHGSQSSRMLPSSSWRPKRPTDGTAEFFLVALLVYQVIMIRLPFAPYFLFKDLITTYAMYFFVSQEPVEEGGPPYPTYSFCLCKRNSNPTPPPGAFRNPIPSPAISRGQPHKKPPRLHRSRTVVPLTRPPKHLPRPPSPEGRPTRIPSRHLAARRVIPRLRCRQSLPNDRPGQ